jgi:threonine/homoserine/homoserine lactone efflux protein
MTLACGAVLVVLGLHAIARSLRHPEHATRAPARERRPGRPFRDDLAASASNLKLAVFLRRARVPLNSDSTNRVGAAVTPDLAILPGH